MLQELDKKRHLLRLWVSPEDNRPLPDVYVSLDTCCCGVSLTYLACCLCVMLMHVMHTFQSGHWPAATRQCVFHCQVVFLMHDDAS